MKNGRFNWASSGKFLHMANPDPGYHGISFTCDVPNASFCTKMRTIVLRDMGACFSPMNSFMLLQDLETLLLKVKKHVYNI